MSTQFEDSQVSSTKFDELAQLEAIIERLNDDLNEKNQVIQDLEKSIRVLTEQLKNQDEKNKFYVEVFKIFRTTSNDCLKKSNKEVVDLTNTDKVSGKKRKLNNQKVEQASQVEFIEPDVQEETEDDDE